MSAGEFLLDGCILAALQWALYRDWCAWRSAHQSQASARDSEAAMPLVGNWIGHHDASPPLDTSPLPVYYAPMPTGAAVPQPSFKIDLQPGHYRLSIGEQKALSRALLSSVKFIDERPLPIELSTDPDGEVALDWREGDDMLSLSVAPSGEVAFAWDIAGRKGSGTFAASPGFADMVFAARGVARGAAS